MKKVWKKIREFLLGIKTGYRFFGVNAGFILIPFAFALLGIGIHILLVALTYHQASEGFVADVNALLVGHGYAASLEPISEGDCVLLSLASPPLPLWTSAVATELGITDKALIEQMTLLENGYYQYAVLMYLLGLIIIVVFYFVSGFVTGYFIKKKRGIPYGWKYTLVNLLFKCVIFAAIVFGLNRLFALVPVISSILALVLIPLVESLFALYRAHLVQRGLRKTKRMFRFVTFKDVLIYLALNWTLYLHLTALVIFLFAAMPDFIILNVVIIMPLFSYLNTYLDVYAEASILAKAKRLEEKQAADAQETSGKPAEDPQNSGNQA